VELLGAPLAVVDLETTGTDPASDRVTEIAVIEIEGFEVVSEWSTLVNPRLSIPAPIQALTGITHEMVSAAPSFQELAGPLYERLAGRVFVAHNARFDYGFLRREFDRVGMKFQAKTLCTVRLSRRLYPLEARHDLDSMIARHGFACRARHRALGDADVLWQFLRHAAGEHGEEVLATAARQVARQPALPPQLDRAAVDAIPEAPGVYVFYGEGNAVLYVGKSNAMRTRVLAHFSNGIRSEPALRLAREVRRIDWQRTAGELGALLREARLVKELGPQYNRQLRETGALCGFILEAGALRLAESAELDADALGGVNGLFRSRRAAMQALRALADEHRLCLQSLGVEARRGGACFRHQIGRCAGACAGRESIQLHYARTAAALARFRAPAWPYRGPVGIVEHDAAREATDVHVVDRWCLLGTAACDAEVAELLEQSRSPRFDYDDYRILERHLARGGARVVELAH
jgi:DNA polymerase-3 subunit epsilon